MLNRLKVNMSKPKNYRSLKMRKLDKPVVGVNRFIAGKLCARVNTIGGTSRNSCELSATFFSRLVSFPKHLHLKSVPFEGNLAFVFLLNFKF